MLVKFRLGTDLLLMFVNQAMVPSVSCNTKPLSKVSFKVALTPTGFFGLADHTRIGPIDFIPVPFVVIKSENGKKKTVAWLITEEATTKNKRHNLVELEQMLFVH